MEGELDPLDSKKSFKFSIQILSNSCGVSSRWINARTYWLRVVGSASVLSLSWIEKGSEKLLRGTRRK